MLSTVLKSIQKSNGNFWSRCIALYRFPDITKISTMVFTERTGLDKLYGVMAYAIDHKRCRRTIWAEHFGEDFESLDCNGMCDNCSSPERREATELQISPFADALKSILAQAERADCRLTGLKLINSLMGKGEAKFRCAEWSPPKELNKPTAELVVANLLLKSFLKEDFSFTPYNTISYLVAGPLIESARFHGDVVEVPRGLCGKPAQRKQAKKRRPDTDDDGELAPIPKKSVNVECISID